ncbi:MAG: hypothetical protein LH606_14015 [Cytophagaceae bacterium]|nr:hypothetical protein [Cytophagaceae bacterium]
MKHISEIIRRQLKAQIRVLDIRIDDATKAKLSSDEIEQLREQQRQLQKILDDLETEN